MKPSGQIKGYYTRECISQTGVSLADANDIRREIDALHERLEGLEKENQDRIGEYRLVMNYLEPCTPEPKQEAKSDQEIYDTLSDMARKFGVKDIDALLRKPTEKRESLAEVLGEAYEDSPSSGVESFPFLAQAAKDFFVRLVDETEKKWSGSDDCTMDEFITRLKKRIEAL
jgi:hypothetical protein